MTLQSIDTEIATLNRRKTHLPERARIAEAMAERKRLLEDYTQAETRVSDVTRAQAKSEADLEPVRARKVRNQERVDAGAASPKDLNNLIAEIEHLTRRIGVLEDAQLELMEEVEQATARFDAIKARRAELENGIRSMMVVRDSELAALDSQLQHAEAKRETVLEKIPAALVTYYERIRDKRDGLGAAELIERRCGGCRLDLTSADVTAYAAAAADEVLLCEECGRILVRSQHSGLPT